MENDLLDDLENLVSDDWQKVHEEFKKKKYQEEISEPVIPDFPTFEEFYNLMVHIATEPTTPILAELSHRIIRNRDRKTSPAFEKVWSFFTDPRKYATVEESCKDCGKSYTVIYERQMMPRVSIDMWDQQQTMEIRQETVACNWCGRPMMHVSGTVVGVMYNRREDAKHKLGENF